MIQTLLLFIQEVAGHLEAHCKHLRVVIFLIDHIRLRPCREVHVIVRPLQACRNSVLVVRDREDENNYAQGLSEATDRATCLPP